MLLASCYDDSVNIRCDGYDKYVLILSFISSKANFVNYGYCCFFTRKVNNE